MQIALLWIEGVASGHLKSMLGFAKMFSSAPDQTKCVSVEAWSYTHRPRMWNREETISLGKTNAYLSRRNSIKSL